MRRKMWIFLAGTCYLSICARLYFFYRRWHYFHADKIKVHSKKTRAVEPDLRPRHVRRLYLGTCRLYPNCVRWGEESFSIRNSCFDRGWAQSHQHYNRYSLHFLLPASLLPTRGLALLQMVECRWWARWESYRTSYAKWTDLLTILNEVWQYYLMCYLFGKFQRWRQTLVITLRFITNHFIQKFR